jgi:hypothetical protein
MKLWTLNKSSRENINFQRKGGVKTAHYLKKFAGEPQAQSPGGAQFSGAGGPQFAAEAQVQVRWRPGGAGSV